MWDNLLTIGLFVLIGWAVLRGGGGRNPRIWSGDTPDEEARRNTRTDSNYRGYDHWNNNSDRGDRKSVVSGKSVSVRVDIGCRRIIKKKTKEKNQIEKIEK